MRKILVVIPVILLVLTSVFAGTTVAEPDGENIQWNEYETENFVIQFEDGYKEDAEYIGEVSEDAYSELLNTMPSEYVQEFSFNDKVHIRVYAGENWDRSQWSLYWENTEPPYIHVQAKSDSEPTERWYEHGIAAEFGNIFIYQIALNENYSHWSRNPSWFNEGLTEYYVYRTPTVNDQFPPNEIQDFNETIKAGDGTFEDISEDRYNGGHLLSMYMIDEYGEGPVWGLVKNDADTFDEAAREELNVTMEQLREGWYRWAEQNIGGDYSQFYDSNNSEEENNEGSQEEKDAEDLENQLSNLEDDLEQAEGQISDLESELDDAEKRISDLEGELNDSEERISDLEDELAEVKNENSDNTTQENQETAISGPGFGFLPLVLAVFLLSLFLGKSNY